MKIWGKSFKENWRDFTIQLIVAAIIAFLIATGLFLTFWSLIKSTFITVISEISEPILLPEYAPYLAFVIGVSSILLFIYLKNKFLLDYKNYRKAEFQGIIWKWRYNNMKDVKTDTLIPICPKCKSQMDMYEYQPKNQSRKRTLFLCNTAQCEYGGRAQFYERDASINFIRKNIAKKVEQNLRKWNLKL